MDKKLQAAFGVAVAVALALGVVNTISLYAEDPEARLRERISIDARDDAYLYNGADLYVYSDDHSTQKFHVDGATGNTTVVGTLATTGAQTFSGLLNANGGIAVDTSAFTVADATGNTVVSGTLAVTSTSTMVGAVAANGGLTVDTSAFSVADTTGNTVVSGTLAVTSTSSLIGDVTASGDLTVDDTLNIDDTDSTLAGTQTLTPTASFYELNPASQLTLTLATASANVGDIVILVNISAQTVNIVDTGATQGGGAVALGQNDPAVFIYTNTKWVEIASPDNS